LDFRRLDRANAKRVIEKLQDQAKNATLVKHKDLKGQWRGLYSLRIGDYRAIYALNHEKRLLIVEVIGHRRDVYDT
jgi:mRNA interferase RelE/StbE